MNSTLRYLFFILGLFSFVSSNSMALSENKPKVTVKLRINSSQQVEIFFSIKNTTQHTISILRDELPWEPSPAMTLVVVDVAGVSLEKVLFAIQPDIMDVVHIRPGFSLGGSIILSESFPTIDVDRKKNDLIVFWTYKPWAINYRVTNLGRVGGHIMLNRQ